MIDENLTYKFYGYHSFDLSKKSKNKIIVLCNSCGKAKTARKENELDQCSSCSNRMSKKQKEINKDRQLTKEHKMKIGKANKGTKQTKETINKRTKSRSGYTHSKETKEKLSFAHRGEKSSSWKGGISNQKYCYKFNNIKKKEIRDKYNNCDFISGLHKDIINNGRNLDVHHVDYNKQQGCNSEWKLIPLSRSNHTKTNNNRWFWNKLFIDVLNIDEWYYELR